VRYGDFWKEKSKKELGWGEGTYPATVQGFVPKEGWN